MEFEDDDYAFCSSFPPSLVSLHTSSSSFSPSPRRLSGCFTQPNKPVRAKRQLAWLSLQGRLVGAEEATSAKTVDINRIFRENEAMAWELFTPIQRVLIVAIVAAAVGKDKRIVNLQRSVQLRDQILSSMQQKLDNLCDQVNYFKDNSEVVVTPNDVSVAERFGCGCEPRKHQNLSANSDLDKTSVKESHEDEMFKYKILSANVVEPEERRMSDLSDWAPSVTSSADIQLEALAFEHDITNLQKLCEEKDVTIKKLSTLIQSSGVAGSKRIAELEDIIRRKNMIITKLRKDLLILEQKTINLTRLRRPSSSTGSSTVKSLPLLADNVLYDMDNTTSPSSSDSDSPHKNQRQVSEPQLSEKSTKLGQKCSQFVKSTLDIELQQRTVVESPLKERSLNYTPNTVSALRPNHSSTASGENRSRRRPPARSKDATPKRWV